MLIIFFTTFFIKKIHVFGYNYPQLFHKILFEDEFKVKKNDKFSSIKHLFLIIY